MRLLTYAILSILFFGISKADAQCLMINSILADACGSPEGANEMVRFSTGATALPIDDISFDWPNNSFLGWCPEPAKTALLNGSITSACGNIAEPPNGILPPFSTVIAVSSTDFNVAANSFASLTDSVYIIYQCFGNTAGHFSNSATTTRTLVINVSGACNGSDNASYIGTNLIGGDGAAIEYFGTTSSYVNRGCNAPLQVLNAGWDFAPAICDNFGIVDLNSLITTATLGGTWSGTQVTGNNFDPSGLAGTTATISYYVEAGGACLISADSTWNIQVESPTTGMDTIYVCDSYNDNGLVFDTSRFIDVLLPNVNTFACDTLIDRYVVIQQANYRVEPGEVSIISGAEVPFQVVNEDLNLQTSWMNQFGDSCNINCSDPLSPTVNNTLYIFELLDESTGCISYDSLLAEVTYYSELNIPSVFTPNGDGQNDVWRAYGKDIKTFKMEVFDRWGGVVFSNEDIDIGWDGTVKSNLAESGLYLYRIYAVGLDDQVFEFQEQLKLIR